MDVAGFLYITKNTLSTDLRGVPVTASSKRTATKTKKMDLNLKHQLAYTKHRIDLV